MIGFDWRISSSQQAQETRSFAAAQRDGAESSGPAEAGSLPLSRVRGIGAELRFCPCPSLYGKVVKR